MGKKYKEKKYSRLQSFFNQRSNEGILNNFKPFTDRDSAAVLKNFEYLHVENNKLFDFIQFTNILKYFLNNSREKKKALPTNRNMV